MRHRVTKKILSRNASHRKALIKNLATQLFVHEQIQTTQAKAKAVQPVIEGIITYVKKHNDLESIRYLNKHLFTETASRKVLKDLKDRYQSKQSGFTRINSVKFRDGDNAHIVLLQLV
jgi:large subunit ribosomal protein L17